jgi:hypothetical protein
VSSAGSTGLAGNVPWLSLDSAPTDVVDSSALLDCASVVRVATAVFSLTSSPDVHAAAIASSPDTRRRRPIVRGIGAL